MQTLNNLSDFKVCHAKIMRTLNFLNDCEVYHVNIINFLQTQVK